MRRVTARALRPAPPSLARIRGAGPSATVGSRRPCEDRHRWFPAL